MLKVINQDGSCKMDIIGFYYRGDGRILGIGTYQQWSDIWLGDYKSEKRAQEVIDEMIRFEEWQTTLVKEPNSGFRVLTKVYRMPKE